MKVSILIVCIWCVTVCLGHKCLKPAPAATKLFRTPEYYWKDFVGIIPEDAIEGGTDENGNTTYVGQAYIRSFELLPVIIYPGCKTATTSAYFSELTADQNIKILCGKDKEKFEWVPTKPEETHMLTDRDLVIGGSEVGQLLNIGRIRHGGRLIIGKVFSHPLANSGLWIPFNGIPLSFKSYEILTYNYNKKTEKISKSESANVSQSTITINMWNDYCT